MAPPIAPSRVSIAASPAGATRYTFAMAYHMTADEFRRYGKELIDWLADYWEKVDDLPIQPEVEPGTVRSRLPMSAPEKPEAFVDVLRDLDRIVMPALFHWQSPGFFGYFPANSSFPSILGELASAGLAQQGMLWSTSPAATEIEAHLMDWLVDLLGLPELWKTSSKGGGVIQMSASDSTHTALVVARNLARRKAPVDQLVVYASEQAHSSIEKGARIAGFEQVCAIPVDDVFALSVGELESQVRTDREHGLTPAFVCSSVGTTGTTAVDPVRSVSEVAARYEMWHHVDAAYAGTAMICPEFRHHQEGLEGVDSYTFNPHKWMFTNFDCSAFFVADRAQLTETLSVQPPYLRNKPTESGEVIDYRDWHVPLGRRFRALKLWFVLRTYGAEGIRHHVREHVRLARWLEEQIKSHPRLKPVAPSPFALVSFAHVEGDSQTDRLAEAINASGHSFVTASKLGGRSFVRVSIGQTHTEPRHVERLWDLIAREA